MSKYKYIGEEDGEGDIHPGDMKEAHIITVDGHAAVKFEGNNGGNIMFFYPNLATLLEEWEKVK